MLLVFAMNKVVMTAYSVCTQNQEEQQKNF
jgi:hypothetical protein